jgi:hypothetical protein
MSVADVCGAQEANMIPAPRLSDVREHATRHPDALCCLLFAPLFSKVAKEGVIPRLGYLNSRSAEHVNFYCAGYGGYWSSEDYPDMESVGDVQYPDGSVIPWAFSQRAFSDFVDEVENISTWHYEGETDLIILNDVGSLTDCLVFDIETMVKDGAIDRPSEIFEALLQFARSADRPGGALGFSDSRFPGILGKALVAAFSEGPKALSKVWKSGRSFAVRNLEK